MHQTIISEAELLPVTYNEEAGVYDCEGFMGYTGTDPEEIRRRGLRLISISEEIKKRTEDQKKEAHKKFILEEILPLSLVLYNDYSTDSHMSIETWKSHYLNENYAVKRWVKSAETVYNYIQSKKSDD